MSVLFEPAKIGNIGIRNRFVRSATAECLASEDGRVTEAYLRVNERLAKGQVGLIIPGSYSVNGLARAHTNSITADHDGVISDLRKVADVVHRHGSKLVGQINHRGRFSNPEMIGTQPIAPSPVRVRTNFVKPRAMTESEIQSTIDDFASAALRLKKAGFDGVQIHAAHGYLVNQFLSRNTNQRTDKWGGNLDNRQRFLLETYQAIRSKVGSDFPILVKINAEDFMNGGLTLGESVVVCKKLDQLGIDAIEVSGGTSEKGLITIRGDVPRDLLERNRPFIQRMLVRAFEGSMRRSARFEEAYFLPHAQAIKKHVRAPIILVGGLRTPSVMEDIIKSGSADFVSLCRPFIRQPKLIRRIEKGENDPISCTNCNRCTVEVIVHHQPLKCYCQKAPIHQSDDSV